MCYRSNEAEEEEESLTGFHVCVVDVCMRTAEDEYWMTRFSHVIMLFFHKIFQLHS